MSPFRVYALLLVAVAVTAGNSCQHAPQKNVTLSYYFWRTGTDIMTDEKDLLRRHHIATLYTKILDVDWDVVNGAIPVASRDIHDFNKQVNTYDSLGVQLIPVVFITNKTFSNIKTTDIRDFAKHVIRKCLPAYDETDRNRENQEYPDKTQLVHPRELQFDCDWTVSTAEKYFQFLKTIRELLPSDSIQLSATIRLHQYKYPGKTGIPPVDRGMLMLYNVSDLTQYSPVNSIFDRKKAAAYLHGEKEYQLPLDIALPAYSWGLVFRNRKFYQIENGLQPETLKANDAFVAIPNPGFPEGEMSAGVSFFRVVKDTVMGELFLRPGDELKIESIDSTILAEAAGLSLNAINSDSYRLAFFELSSNEIKRFSDETIAHIYSSYR